MCDEVSLIEEVACWKGLGGISSKSALGVRDHLVGKAAERVPVLRRWELKIQNGNYGE